MLTTVVDQENGANLVFLRHLTKFHEHGELDDSTFCWKLK